MLARGADWLVVAKPPRLVAHRAHPGDSEHALLQHVRDQIGRRVHLVHRLDRGTSGCVLIATHSKVAADLADALADPRASKTYVTLVRGEWRHGEQLRIDRPLLHRGQLRPARTDAEPLCSCAEPRGTLVRCTLGTGRTHQIRRHLAGVNHPVLGDSQHGDSRENQRWRREYGLHRLALHALKLSLPRTEHTPAIEAVCPLPIDLHAVATQMPCWQAAQQAEPALAQPPIDLGDGTEEGARSRYDPVR